MPKESLMNLPPPPPMPPPDCARGELLTVATARPQPGTVLVQALGEMDLATSPVLAAELGEVLRPPFPTRLGVDLSGVTFISSSGLSVLVELHRLAQVCGTDMRLVKMSRPVRRALDLNGLDLVLKFYDPVAGVVSG
jgi:anti-sigma B factor antagonist